MILPDMAVRKYKQAHIWDSQKYVDHYYLQYSFLSLQPLLHNWVEPYLDSQVNLVVVASAAALLLLHTKKNSELLKFQFYNMYRQTDKYKVCKCYNKSTVELWNRKDFSNEFNDMIKSTKNLENIFKNVI